MMRIFFVNIFHFVFSLSNMFDKSPLERISQFSKKLSQSFTKNLVILDLICNPEKDRKLVESDVHEKVFGNKLIFDPEEEKKEEQKREELKQEESKKEEQKTLEENVP